MKKRQLKPLNKIIQCITLSEKGGSQVDVAHLLEGYAEYEQVLVSGQEEWLTEHARSLGLEVIIVPSLVREIHPIRDWQAVADLKRVFERIQPDLIHLHTAKAGLVGRIAARACDIPNIYTPHGWTFSGRSKLPLRLVSGAVERATRHLSDVVIAVSKYEGEIALKLRACNQEQLRMIYNGIPDSTLHAKHASKRTPVIVMVARFAPPKQQEAVIKALSIIQSPFKLVFVGDGPTRPYVEQLAATSPISDRIEFLGTRLDVDRILANADLLVHASNYEALCMSVIEAMRACLPVVAWSKGGIEELIEPGSTGLMAHNSQQFCEHVHLLLQNHELREKLGQAARSKYLRMFTLEVMLRQTGEIYQELTQARNYHTQKIAA